MALGLHKQGLVRLVLGDLDLVQAADLGEQQPEAHPALGDRAVLRLDRLLVLALVVGIDAALLAVALHLLPDGVEPLGIASCRERVCKYVSISVVAISFK